MAVVCMLCMVWCGVVCVWVWCEWCGMVAFDVWCLLQLLNRSNKGAYAAFHVPSSFTPSSASSPSSSLTPSPSATPSLATVPPLPPTTPLPAQPFTWSTVQTAQWFVSQPFVSSLLFSPLFSPLFSSLLSSLVLFSLVCSLLFSSLPFFLHVLHSAGLDLSIHTFNLKERTMSWDADTNSLMLYYNTKNSHLSFRYVDGRHVTSYTIPHTPHTLPHTNNTHQPYICWCSLGKHCFFFFS